MSTASKEKRKERARLVRKAKHDEALAHYERRAEHPLTKIVSYGICCSVYGARCACEKRPDMAACSSMIGAALHAIFLVSRFDGQLPLRAHGQSAKEE